MERLRQILAGLGLAYTLIFSVLYVIGGRPALFAGIVLIGFYSAMTTGQPANGLPWMVLWALLHMACRIVTGLLPPPGRRRQFRMPREQTPPPAVPAVIVAPACTPESCPDEAGMPSLLSPELRRLIR